ncbi:MAG: LacI family DNA-binding transcriptional regulator [Lachnospiraceae bacterium]|nr:LacI family DNA-binding transcriptional regulator [Lachnospiraceae bacterium]
MTENTGRKTIEDIASIVGCSVGTVSRAINNRKGVSEKTRLKILKIMDDVGYQPNAVAQSLSKSKTNTIALLIPEFSHEFLGKMAQAIEAELSAKGYRTLLFNTHWDPAVERRMLIAAQAQRVDGIILKPSLNSVDFMKDISTPTVLVSHTFGDDLSYVDIENEKAGFMAAEYLIQRGYKRLAFVGGKTNISMAELRYNGYQKALKQYGLPCYPEYYSKADDSISEGYLHTEQLLRLPNRPDAVFCMGDMTALGACKSAYEHGLNIPTDIGIMGFNNDEIADLPQVSLTTVMQPKEKMGKMAARMILDKIEQTDEWYPQKLLYKPEIIARSSTK